MHKILAQVVPLAGRREGHEMMEQTAHWAGRRTIQNERTNWHSAQAGKHTAPNMKKQTACQANWRVAHEAGEQTASRAGM